MKHRCSSQLLAIAGAATLSITNACGAADEIAAQDLAGVWAGGQLLPATTGQLTIDGTAERWRATIADATANVNRNNDAVTVGFPDNAGEFRGKIKGNKISGHWIQPPNEINNNAYATPVELTEVRQNLWRGTVGPLEPMLSVYVSIQQTSDGLASAVIRNPELNLFRRNVYRVTVHDGTISFSDVKDSDSHFEAKLDARKSEFSARLPNIGHEIVFRRSNRSHTVGFFSGPTHDYHYRKPATIVDGWTTAALSEVDLNPKLIAELIDRILVADPTKNPLNIHSLLIARHGRLVLDEYFYGFKRDEPHTMRSASKTFAPMLVGIAQDRGAKIDIETPAYAQFPEYKEFSSPDSRKAKITVRDLMTMTSGLTCDDNDENSPGNEDVMQQQTAQPDWYKYTLDLPLVREPGGDQAVYCSAGINLLGGIVRNVTHTWLPEFFYENVAKPLQIKTYHWNLMPNGDGYAGGGLYLRPRDQLKLGQLYLNGGVWNGTRVISKEWVTRSTSRQSTFGQTLGTDHDYGYGWHLLHFEVGNVSYRAFAAGGNGGQIVMVIPDLDLVVGFTGGAYGEFAKWYKWQTELVPQFIIPAATSTPGR